MEGVITAERIAGQAVQPINYDHVPGCTYCDPEIGSVGLTEAQAKEQGYDVRVGSFPFGVLGRAKMAGETEGFVKIVADTKYDEVLGVHMIGPRSTRARGRSRAGALRLGCTVRRGDQDHARAPDVRRGCGRSGSCDAWSGNTHVAMATPVVMPQMGESIAEGADRPLDQESRRRGRSRRAAVRDLDRQGRCRDSVAGRRRADGDQGQRGRNGRGQLGRRHDWRREGNDGAS